MSINDMMDRIGSLADKRCGTGATDLEIVDAEREIGVRLPASYKAFLSTFGWARLFDDALYGVGPTVPSQFLLVMHVFCERYEAHPHIPRHLVPVMNDGAGNHYCLDTANFHGSECPVVFWDHEHEEGSDQLPNYVSPSFDRWIVDRIATSPHADER